MTEFDFDAEMARARRMMAKQLEIPVIPKEWEYRVTTPPRDADTGKLLETLSYDRLSYVDVVPVPGARPGWCFHNVRDHVAVHGGDIEHGVIVWGAPGTYFETEFHAVWVRPDGRRIDITPKVDGERQILFASDPTRYPSDFDFLLRPPNTRWKIYTSDPGGDALRKRIASLSAASLDYEGRRALAKGMTLEAWMATRLPKDALEIAIDGFLTLADRHDEFLMVTDEGTTIRDRGLLQRYAEVARRLVKAKLKVWVMVEMGMLRSLAEEHRSGSSEGMR